MPFLNLKISEQDHILLKQACKKRGYAMAAYLKACVAAGAEQRYGVMFGKLTPLDEITENPTTELPDVTARQFRTLMFDQWKILRSDDWGNWDNANGLRSMLIYAEKELGVNPKSVRALYYKYKFETWPDYGVVIAQLEEAVEKEEAADAKSRAGGEV